MCLHEVCFEECTSTGKRALISGARELSVFARTHVIAHFGTLHLREASFVGALRAENQTIYFWMSEIIILYQSRSGWVPQQDASVGINM